METAGRIDVHFCENIALVEDEPTFSQPGPPSPPHPRACRLAAWLWGYKAALSLESVKMVRLGVCSGRIVEAGRPPCLFSQDKAVAFISLL